MEMQFKYTGKYSNINNSDEKGDARQEEGGGMYFGLRILDCGFGIPDSIFQSDSTWNLK
jgi:hypothetical protein